MAITAILSKYPTYEFIFQIFMEKTIIKLLYKFRAKKLINIKVKKPVNFGFKKIA